MKKLERLYEHIYKITLQIGYLIENNQFGSIQEILDKRMILFDEVNEIIEKTSFSEEEKTRLNTIVDKYKSVEDKNIALLEKKQNEVGKKLGKVNSGKKALSAYKVDKIIPPRIIDGKE